MIKKIVTIVLPIIAVTTAIFIFGLKVYQESFEKFQYDGFVIGSANGKESSKYHFSKDEKYKVDETKGEVSFKNNEEEDVVVPDASFVHYTDGSISTFKKAVVLNTANVKTDSLQYYNVFNGSVFTKTSDGYQIKYLEQTLSFEDFLIKISDTKYMLVGKNLEIKYGEKKEVVKDGFLEINYLDGNIVRIENQDLLLQNISTDIEILVNSVSIDLLDKKIIYEDETKVNLGEITIDSDDNIEITPDETNTEIIEQEAQNEISDIENQPVVSPGVDVSGMESGVIDTNVEKVEQIVQDNKKIPDPKFIVTKFVVEPSLVETSIEIKDDGNILTGDVEIKVVDNSTNDTLCKYTYTYGNYFPSYSCDALIPGRNYLLIAKSKYEKNEVIYEKDFLQKTFITPTPGITIDKEYVSSSDLAFKVKLREDSTVQSFKYRVVESDDPDTPILTGTFDRNESGAECSGSVNSESQEGDDGVQKQKINECTVTIKSDEIKLKSNQKYSLIIDTIQSDTGMPMGNSKYEIFKTVSTLKEKPYPGSTAVTINKLSSEFVLYMNGLKDTDNSAISYKVEVYDDHNNIVTVNEAPATGQMKIAIDDKVIVRSKNYKARVYLRYYDNEKEYETHIGTQDMYMSSIQPPTVEPDFNCADCYVEHDKINATIRINDPDHVIVKDTEIIVKIINQSDGTAKAIKVFSGEFNGETDMYIKLGDKVKGLRANTNYLFVVQATLRLEKQTESGENGDKDISDQLSDIGSFVVKTPPVNTVVAVWEDLTASNKSDGFTVNFALTDSVDYYKEGYDFKLTEAEYEKLSQYEKDVYNEKKNLLEQYELKTLQRIKFRFRKANSVIKNDSDCNAQNQCWEVAFSNTGEYATTLKDMFYVARSEESYNEEIMSKIKLKDSFKATFGQKSNVSNVINFSMESLDFGLYYLEIVEAVDYTTYQNKLNILNSRVEVNVNGEEDRIVDPEYFVEDFIWDTNIFDEGVTKDGGVTGYQITPKLNLPELQKEGDSIEEVQMEYFIVDLKTGEMYSLNKLDTEAHFANKQLLKHGDNYSISFTFEDYNAISEIHKLKRGNPYGFCYSLKIGKPGADGIISESEATYGYETDNSGKRYFTYVCNDTKKVAFRKFKDDRQPLRKPPTVSSYLKTTSYNQTDGNTMFIFKYSASDPDKSLFEKVDADGVNKGKSVQYKTGTNEEYTKYATCDSSSGYTKEINCLHTNSKNEQEFAISLEKQGTVSAIVPYKTLDASLPEYGITDQYSEKELIKNLTLAPVLEPFDGNSGNDKVKYIVDNQTKGIIKFQLTNLLQKVAIKTYVAGVKITLVPNTLKNSVYVPNYNKAVVIYKKFDDNGFDISGSSALPTISVRHEEIMELEGAPDISADIELLYDRNFYGFEQETSTNNYDYAVVSTRNRYNKFDDLGTGTTIFDKLNDENTDKLTVFNKKYVNPYSILTSKPILKEPLALTYSNGQYYYYDSGNVPNYVNVKRLFKRKVECAQNCYFGFEVTKPIFIMEEEDVTESIGTIKYKFSLTKSSSLANFKLIRLYYPAKATIEVDPTTKEQVVSYKCSGDILKDSSGNGKKMVSYFDGTDTVDLENTEDYEMDKTNLYDEKIYTEKELSELPKTEDGRYILVEENLGIGKDYCVMFQYSGKIKNIASEGELTKEDYQHYGYANFYYGAEYHSTNSDREGRPREYFATPSGHETISSSGSNFIYDIGTIQSTNENWSTLDRTQIQRQDWRRSLSFMLKFNSEIKETDWLTFQVCSSVDKGADGKVEKCTKYADIDVDSVFVKTGDINASQTFSLDPIINELGEEIYSTHTNGDYYLKITPYRFCKTSNNPAIGGNLSTTYDCVAAEDFKWKSNYEAIDEKYRDKDGNIDPKVVGWQNIISNMEKEEKDGLQRLYTSYLNFTYDIKPATISVVRTGEGITETGNFSVNVVVDDKYRSVGDYSGDLKTKTESTRPAEYKVRVSVNGEIYKLSTDNEWFKAGTSTKDEKTFKLSSAMGAFAVNDITVCKGVHVTSCKVIVEYETDIPEETINGKITATRTTHSYEKTINTAIEADMGNIQAKLSAQYLTLNFSSYYNIGYAKKYNYILSEEGSTTIITGDNGTGFVYPDEDAENVKMLKIPLTTYAVRKKTYSLYIKFRDENGEFVADWETQGLSIE